MPRCCATSSQRTHFNRAASVWDATLLCDKFPANALQSCSFRLGALRLCNKFPANDAASVWGCHTAVQQSPSDCISIVQLSFADATRLRNNSQANAFQSCSLRLGWHAAVQQFPRSREKREISVWDATRLCNNFRASTLKREACVWHATRLCNNFPADAFQSCNFRLGCRAAVQQFPGERIAIVQLPFGIPRGCATISQRTHFNRAAPVLDVAIQKCPSTCTSIAQLPLGIVPENACQSCSSVWVSRGLHAAVQHFPSERISIVQLTFGDAARLCNNFPGSASQPCSLRLGCCAAVQHFPSERISIVQVLFSDANSFLSPFGMPRGRAIFSLRTESNGAASVWDATRLCNCALIFQQTNLNRAGFR
ncbi:unnamed protein product [Symbiodinium sp. CCMP2592]|nr:unnamed protein product [Symbiodinium sp. CCMP2592]